ncbi:OmpH family outer membrane protein [Spiribacter halobius]|uniref:Molecular chaperone Skp n=1 Tax=Sediminicurvatus halobius TaxID=2182432 RepID=A0A2U2N4A1_9GAMM|nr:OmpH family outer membrane protein [Spiribacter halobius]PWG63913.1 hypothetical protein DEM34_06860 [Spiribacter halobius]UEX76326.1 OmpH family outer membrane protein [Spiribacter halobius]
MARLPAPGRPRLLPGLIVTLLCLLLAAPAVAQDGLRIGFVNPGRVSSEAPQAEAAREKLQEEFAPRDEEIVAMQEELRELEDRLSRETLELPEEERQRLEREIVSRRRDIQRTQEAFREDFNMRRNEELGQLQRRILRTVSEFAEEQGYDLVVSDGVVYASDAINITDLIIERLRRQYEQANGGE